MNTYSDGLYG